MIAVDTNILVYAHRRDAAFHVVASRRVGALATGAEAWAIPWPCIHEFLAIVTHPRIYRPPTPLPLALDQVDAWLESPSIVLLAESDDHWRSLKEALTRGQVVGAAVHDGRIAAICQQHGVRELWSADRDFSRLGGIVVKNPLLWE